MIQNRSAFELKVLIGELAGFDVKNIQVLPIGVLHWEFKVHNAALQRQQHEEMQDA